MGNDELARQADALINLARSGDSLGVRSSVNPGLYHEL